MKYSTLLVGFYIVWSGSESVAQEDANIPPFERLDAVAGSRVDSDDFKQLLHDFRFSENPKRENSWGSRFGVFLEQSKKGLISIGIRPPSSATNMPTYSGTLPRGLVSEETIKSIKQKLGEPKHVEEPAKGYVVLRYDGFHVTALEGKLFELWLTELNDDAEQNDESKSGARRFHNRK